MMKSVKGFVLGVVSTLLIFSLATTTYATITGRTIDIVEDVRLFLYGKPLEMTNASDKVVKPFVHDGTTYVPVRGLSEALGQAVAWDSQSKSVYIDKPLSSEERLGISKFVFEDWYFGNLLTEYTIDFQSCQLAITGGNYYASTYIPSEKHVAFFEEAEQYGLPYWNAPDWKFDNGNSYGKDSGIDVIPSEDGATYFITLVFDDGTQVRKYWKNTFPENWMKMREAFITLTGKDILIHDPANYK